MTSTATAALARTKPAYAPGTLVLATDRHHGADGDYTGSRPHLIMASEPGRYYLIELSHTAQGTWRTDELPTETATRSYRWSYLATRHFRTGEWMGRWYDASDCRRWGRQLSPETAAEAVSYCWAELERAEREGR